MEYLFVYGSLRKGTKQSAQSRQGVGTEYERFLEMNGTYMGAASAEGRMILLDGYPGFVDGKGTVLGDLYQVTTAVIKKLDKYEDIEFERLKRSVTGPDGPIEAWVYVYRFSPTGKKRIDSGDWSGYQELSS
ncbi:MAG: gamma-glutamylcyclotransferase [Acidobacteria bacterium]|nr:gamma-glutamylcyclotransferase [Acidobacteriota bacterium]